MKSLIALLAVCFALALDGFSQPPAPPPPVKNLNVDAGADLIPGELTDADGWRQFVSLKGDIRILLPSQPEKEIQPMNEGVFKTQLVTFTTSKNDQLYMLGFVDFKINFEDKDTIEGFYKGWQEGFTENLIDSSVQSENINFKGKSARKILIKNSVLRIEAIGVFARGRMYQLAVFSPNNEPAGSELAERARLTSKFFDSFVFDQSDLPKSGAADVSPVENSVYKNERFNFNLTLPENWVEISKSDSMMFAEIVKEADPSLTRKGKSELESSLKKTEILFHYSKKPIGAKDNASYVCAVEPVGVTRATMRQIAVASQQNFDRNMGYEITTPAKRILINGAEFYLIEMKKQNEMGAIVYQSIYLRKIGNVVLQFAFTYSEQESLKTMKSSLETIRFGK